MVGNQNISLSPAFSLLQDVKSTKKAGENDNFAQLLALFDSKKQEKTADDSISALLGANVAGLMGQEVGSDFSFSSDFESTFGLSGPLPNYITMISSALHLTTEQNQALQDIAVRNKDITKSNESVQALAQQLQQAGIVV